jgi:hypothetical protein
LRRNRVATLREIAAVRTVQCIAAEHKAVQMAAAVRAKDIAAQEAERSRELAERNWLRAVNAPSLSPNDATWWSAQLRREEGASQQASRARDDAMHVSQRRGADWHAAILRRDVADDLAADAKKQDMRRCEDASVQEALDRHAFTRRSR